MIIFLLLKIYDVVFSIRHSFILFILTSFVNLFLLFCLSLDVSIFTISFLIFLSSTLTIFILLEDLVSGTLLLIPFFRKTLYSFDKGVNFF